MNVERIKELLKVERQIVRTEARLIVLKQHQEDILKSLGKQEEVGAKLAQ